MQLKILPHSNVRDSPRVPLGDIRHCAHLIAAQQAVWNANAHHKVRHGLALAARAADHSQTVALRVNAPRPEIRANPFRRNRRKAVARKRTNLVEMLPGILRALQTLDALRFGFFDFAHGWPTCLPKPLTKNKKPTWPVPLATWASEL